MNRTTLLFVLAACFNFSIIIVSKGFGPDLGHVDPLFGSAGSAVIVLWGFAYLALAQTFQKAPAVALVFALEKAFFAVHWGAWIVQHADTLESLIERDPMTGFFFAGYGVGDACFMVFFAVVAWRGRANLWRQPNAEAARTKPQ